MSAPLLSDLITGPLWDGSWAVAVYEYSSRKPKVVSDDSGLLSFTGERLAVLQIASEVLEVLRESDALTVEAAFRGVLNRRNVPPEPTVTIEHQQETWSGFNAAFEVVIPAAGVSRGTMYLEGMTLDSIWPRVGDALWLASPDDFLSNGDLPAALLRKLQPGGTYRLSFRSLGDRRAPTREFQRVSVRMWA